MQSEVSYFLDIGLFDCLFAHEAIQIAWLEEYQDRQS